MSEPGWSARDGGRGRSAWGRVGAAVALACVAAAAGAETLPNEGFAVPKPMDIWIPASVEDRAGGLHVLPVSGKGNTAATAGSSFDATIEFGAKVDKCPTATGIVTGTGIWSVTYDRHIRQADGMHNSLISVRADAVFTGHVGDDGRLNRVDVVTQYRSEGRGSIRTNEGAIVSVPSTSLPGHLETSYPVTNGKWGDLGVKAVDPLSAHIDQGVVMSAIMANQAELAFVEAEANWLMNNVCVEMKFDPATSTTRVAPGESVRVKAEVQTKKGTTTVGAGFLDAGPNAGGSVMPKQGRSEVGTPITFTYTAPQDKAGNKGFWAAAVSRAGAAKGDWAPLGSGALKFEGLSFVCEIPVPGSKEVLHTEQQIKGDSCDDLNSWTIRPTNVTRGPGGRGVQPGKAFQTSCEPTGGPEAEARIRARRARPAGAGGWVCTYAVGADGAVTLTFFNFKSSFCQGAKEETFTVTAQPTDKCGEPPPQQRPPPTVPVVPPL